MKLRRREIPWILATAGGLCVLLAAGMLMSASRPVRDIANICSDPNVFQIELQRPFQHARLRMYVAPVRSDPWRTPNFLKHPLLGNMRLGPANTDDARRRSTVIVCEDDRLLGPRHSQEDAIARLGRGRYTHYQGSGRYYGILFSTSDNSDPNSNGRRYRAIEP